MSLYWLVCLVCCGNVLFTQHVTGSSIPLNRQARYEEVDQAEFDCSGRASGYFVHPTICSAYYACANGKAYKSKCLPGLLYHQTTTYCEKAELVDCSRSTTVAMTTITSTTGSTTVSTTQPVTTSTTQRSMTTKSTTPSTVMTTTAATTMKSTTMMTSSTTRMTTPLSTLTTSPAPTTTVSSTVPTTKMTTRAPTTRAHSDKADCRHHPLGTLLRNPNDCNSFYECLAGGPILLHCGPFTVFNPKIKNCDFKYNVPECDV